MTLSEAGLARGLRLLGTEARPRGLTWKKFKATSLQALGLGLPSSSATLTWLADADGFRAALLQRQFGGGGKPTPTLHQVRDRLLWRQLGVETHRPFTLRAVQAHLLGTLLELDVTDPDHALEQLAARAAGATRVDADAVRLANARAGSWPGNNPRPSPSLLPHPRPRPRARAPPRASRSRCSRRPGRFRRATASGRTRCSSPMCGGPSNRRGVTASPSTPRSWRPTAPGGCR
ncbi:hypothetical protein ACN28S_27335 [Cystobacter fuscus]